MNNTVIQTKNHLKKQLNIMNGVNIAFTVHDNKLLIINWYKRGIYEK